MEIIETLNNRINKLLKEHKKLEFENNSLNKELLNLKNQNDELTKNNENMFLRIDTTLTVAKAKSE